MSAPTSAQRDAELTDIVTALYRASEGNPLPAEVEALVRYAYLMGKSDGLDRGAEIWRRSFESLAKGGSP